MEHALKATMKHIADRMQEDRSEFIDTLLSPVHRSDASPVGVKQTLILIGLTFGMVGVMRCVLCFLHTGGQFW